LSTKVTKEHEEKTFVPLFVSLVDVFITAKTTPRGRGKGQGIAAARARKFRRRPTNTRAASQFVVCARTFCPP
jgi:hypothetical protein